MDNQQFMSISNVGFILHCYIFSMLCVFSCFGMLHTHKIRIVFM